MGKRESHKIGGISSELMIDAWQLEEIPNEFNDLINIPGIGEYTASAIMVFGFGKKKQL